MNHCKSKIFKYLLLLIYSILVFVLAYHHELWRDEVDVWLFVRDTDFTTFFRYLSNSGHPGLWHLVLLPFAKLGFPNYTITVIHVLIGISTAYLILFHSTFKPLFSVLLIFSYYFFFEYTVVSRNYALYNFLLFLIATLYPKRFDKPVLFGIIALLLANCNIYATVIASGVGLIYLVEVLELKKNEAKILLGLTIIFLGGVVCLIQLIPTAERQTSPTDTGFFYLVNFMAFPVAIVYSFAPGLIGLRTVFSFLILPLAFLTFYSLRKVFIFFAWVILILSLSYTFIFMHGYRHAGFLFITLIFALWIKSYYEINPKPETVYDSLSDYILSFIQKPEKLFWTLLTVSLLVSVRFSFQEAKKDILYSFSNAKEMSEFILANGYDSDKYLFSAHSADNCKTVLFYLKNTKKFYYPGIDSFGSHMLWDAKMGIGEKMSRVEALYKTQDKFKGQDNILYLTDHNFGETNKDLTLLYKTKSRNEFKKEEEFYLYQVSFK